ncbi:protein-disulfide reductase DsbD family protein [Megalodesulfovibrio gigas]|nr:cytochrome c biogenesis protein CcdA [Megalodesulfovibrio gigas]
MLVAWLVLFLAGSPGTGPGAAAFAQDSTHVLEWELAAHPDGRLTAVLWITPGAGLYTYSHSPGLLGQPTTFTPADGAVQAVRYMPGVEKPDTFDPGTIIRAYLDRTPLFLDLTGSAFPLEIRGELQMLFCSDTSCWPVREAVSHRWESRPQTLASMASPPLQALYTASAPGKAPSPPVPETATAADAIVTDDYAFAPQFFRPGLEVGGLGKALLLAFLAGMLLNAMPCVLPVLSLKCSAILAVSGQESRREQERQFREHSIWFAVGILCYFFILGGVLGLAGLAWGQLFQQPALLLGLAVVLFMLGLSLFGVFDLPMIDLKGNSGPSDRPRLQAFSTGVLATLLATPCSGPLLGGVLGWTLSRSPSTILPVFMTIGAGMTVPYLGMAIWPSLVRVLPRPGVWNIHLERGLGFLLVGTTIYLVQILPQSLFTPALVCLWAAGFSAWMWGQWTTLSQPRILRWGIRAAAACLIAVAVAWALTPGTQGVVWEPFDPVRFGQHLGNQPVLMDFTADWCPNCKVLESTTLRDSVIKPLQERYGLTLIKVDMTQEDARKMALLKALGSQSIPVVAIFPTGDAARSPMILRDLFTSGQLADILEETFTNSP